MSSSTEPARPLRRTTSRPPLHGAPAGLKEQGGGWRSSWTRKQDRHQRGRQPLELVDGLLAASATEADPRVEWLYRQIGQLKDVDRSVALLMLDGLAYSDIAAIVGISEDNVAVKINRIKAALTTHLAKEAEL